MRFIRRRINAQYCVGDPALDGEISPASMSWTLACGDFMVVASLYPEAENPTFAYTFVESDRCACLSSCDSETFKCQHSTESMHQCRKCSALYDCTCNCLVNPLQIPCNDVNPHRPSTCGRAQVWDLQRGSCRAAGGATWACSGPPERWHPRRDSRRGGRIP